MYRGDIEKIVIKETIYNINYINFVIKQKYYINQFANIIDLYNLI